jgi:orotate phosphoribosyltransferase
VQHDEWRPRLRQLLLDHALIRGEIILASGRVSPYYIDGKMVTLSAEGAYLAAQGILEAVAGDALDAIGGPPRGADPLGGAVAALSFPRGRPLVAFMIRKEPKTHGTRKMIEGPLPPHARVAIVEDVVTTGGSVLDAIAVVEAAGATVARIVVLVDRLAGAREAFERRGYPFTPLFTIEDLGVSPLS